MTMRRAVVLVGLSLATAGLVVGCGEETSDGGGSAGAKADGGAAGASSVFGISTLVFADQSSSSYLRLDSSLPSGGAALDLDSAREFVGNSDVGAHEGFVFVALGDEPTIVKYEVLEDLTLSEVSRVSFVSYGVLSAALWNNQFVAADKAYLTNGASELIAWNPKTMEIVETIALPELEERDGLKVVSGMADRSSIVHEGKFYLPLYWTDDNYAERSDDSTLVVIDVGTNTVDKTLSAPCPGLDYATADEEGKLHFSNWTGGVGTYYVLGTAQNCIATLDPESEEITTRTFASISGGHEGAAFKYAGDGRFVFSSFDEVKADIESAEDPFTPVGGLNWQLYVYDAKSGESVPVDGVDWNSGANIYTSVGGDFFAMVPGEGYATTRVYSLDGTSGSAAFDITGWSFRLFRVR